MSTTKPPPNAALDRLNFEFDKLSSIPTCIGKTSKFEEDETHSTIIFKLLPSPKLTITKPAYFKVVLPATWPVKPPAVTLVQGDVPPGSVALALNQPVKCLLLDEIEGWSRTYNLSIIYYTMRDLFKKSNNGVEEDLKFDIASTPWLPSLPVDLPSGKHFGFIAGHAGGQGRRRTMEDCVIIKQGINLTKHYTNSAALFGIFDGHAGDTCVKFVEETFPQVLIEELNKTGDFREGMGNAFLKTDEAFISDESLANSKAGCTACAVVFDGSDRLFAANLGDCRAVLCRAGGTTLELTSDCRATRPDEMARIVANGGFVNNKRVNGQLAVSRALGDVDYKKPKALVSAAPELSEIRLQDRDEFLIIACDGLWDVLSSEEAVMFVRERIQKGSSEGGGVSVTHTKLSAIANELVKHAIDDKKSSDNVSALIAKVVSPELDGGLFQQSLDSAVGGGGSSNKTNSTSGGGGSPKGSTGLTFGGISFDEDDDFDAPSPKEIDKTTSSSGGGKGVSSLSSTPNDSSASPIVPLKVKGASIDTDEGLMEFLMDDANFKD